MLVNQLGPADERALDPMVVAVFHDNTHFQQYFSPQSNPVMLGSTTHFQVASQAMQRFGRSFCGINPERTELVEPAFFMQTGAWATQVFPRPLPVWLIKGLQQICIQAEIHGERVVFGGPSEVDVNLLNGKVPMPLTQLMRPLEVGDIVSAEAWLLVHYLLWGDHGANRPLLKRYLEAWAAGDNEKEAAAIAFPGGLDELSVRLVHHLNRDRIEGESIVLPAACLNAIKVEQPDDTEMAILLGYMFLVANEPALAQAQEQFELAAARAPHSVAVLEAEGYLAMMRKNPAEAEGYFRQALAAGSKWQFAHATRALGLVRPVAGMMNSAPDGADPKQARAAAIALQELLKLNPYYSLAYQWYSGLIGALDQITAEDEAVMVKGRQLYPRSQILMIGWAALHLKRGENEAARAELAKLRAGPIPVPMDLAGYARKIDDRLQIGQGFGRVQLLYLEGRLDEAGAALATLPRSALSPDEKNALLDLEDVLENFARARAELAARKFGAATGAIDQALQDNPPAPIRAQLKALSDQIAAAKAQAAKAAP